VKRIPRRSSYQDQPVYEARTRDVVVRVITNYLPDQSDPADGQWVWAYMVEIENHGVETVQLVSRHWIITDALNRVEEVKGAGVVGEQPLLKPGEAFRYTSGCPLATPSGAMHGSYQMLTDDGESFPVEIPAFSLDLPGARKALN
jgi:ApaG protein